MAREWIRQRLQEAERERLARPDEDEREIGIERQPGSPWRARLALAIGRRLRRVAEAS